MFMTRDTLYQLGMHKLCIPNYVLVMVENFKLL